MTQSTPILQLRSRIENALGTKGDAVCNAIRAAGNTSPSMRITREGLSAVLQKQGVKFPRELMDDTWKMVQAKTSDGVFSKDILVGLVRLFQESVTCN